MIQIPSPSPPTSALQDLWPVIRCSNCSEEMHSCSYSTAGVYADGWVCDVCPEQEVEIMPSTCARYNCSHCELDLCRTCGEKVKQRGGWSNPRSLVSVSAAQSGERCSSGITAVTAVESEPESESDSGSESEADGSGEEAVELHIRLGYKAGFWWGWGGKVTRVAPGSIASKSNINTTWRLAAIIYAGNHVTIDNHTSSAKIEALLEKARTTRSLTGRYHLQFCQSYKAGGMLKRKLSDNSKTTTTNASITRTTVHHRQPRQQPQQMPRQRTLNRAQTQSQHLLRPSNRSPQATFAKSANTLTPPKPAWR